MLLGDVRQQSGQGHTFPMNPEQQLGTCPFPFLPIIMHSCRVIEEPGGRSLVTGVACDNVVRRWVWWR